jgi:TonB family protein
MTRLQKKCLLFSLGLHGLLAVILIGSAGFGSRPQPTDLQILSFIPANIVDRAGAGGGARAVNPTTQPQVPAPPRVQLAPQTQPQAVHVEQAHAEPVRPKPLPRAEAIQAPPEKEDSKEVAMESKPKPSHERPRHEVKPTFTLAHASTSAKKNQVTQSSQSSARAEARRLKAIENALAELASGVRNSGSQSPIVDTEGIGGGEAFAGYRDVVFSYYYHAWITPDDAANRLGAADARITILRDGSILSAELVHPSEDKSLDRSVERVLREVTKLPPFPASTQDRQRTYVIRFSLEAKELSG